MVHKYLSTQVKKAIIQAKEMEMSEIDRMLLQLIVLTTMPSAKSTRVTESV